MAAAGPAGSDLEVDRLFRKLHAAVTREVDEEEEEEVLEQVLTLADQGRAVCSCGGCGALCRSSFGSA